MANDPLNEILLDLTDIAWANGSIDADAQRELAGAIADKVGTARQQRDMLIHWLLRAYATFNRHGWEEGWTDSETSDALLNVLANLNLDPNLSDDAKEILKRKPVYYVADREPVPELVESALNTTERNAETLTTG